MEKRLYPSGNDQIGRREQTTVPEKRASLSDRYWKLPWLVRIGVLVGGFIVVASTIGAVNRATGGALLEASGSSSPAAAPSPATPRAVDLPPGAITPGVYLVGTDVQPGTYRTQGAHPTRRRTLSATAGS